MTIQIPFSHCFTKPDHPVWNGGWSIDFEVGSNLGGKKIYTLSQINCVNLDTVLHCSRLCFPNLQTGTNNSTLNKVVRRVNQMTWKNCLAWWMEATGVQLCRFYPSLDQWFILLNMIGNRHVAFFPGVICISRILWNYRRLGPLLKESRWRRCGLGSGSLLSSCVADLCFAHEEKWNGHRYLISNFLDFIPFVFSDLIPNFLQSHLFLGYSDQMLQSSHRCQHVSG